MIGFGDHHLSLLVPVADNDALNPAMAGAGAALADLGAVVVREDINVEPVFRGQFPGNEGYAAQRDAQNSPSIRIYQGQPIRIFTARNLNFSPLDFAR